MKAVPVFCTGTALVCQNSVFSKTALARQRPKASPGGELEKIFDF